METKRACLVAVLLTLLGPIVTWPVQAQDLNESALPTPLSMQLPGASRPGADPLRLLQSAEVRKELALSEGQIQELQQLDRDTRARVRSLAGARSRGGSASPSVAAVRGFEAQQQEVARQSRQRVAEILGPAQLEAFKAIVEASPGQDPLQLLISDGMRARLGLTEAQAEQLRQVAAQAGPPGGGRSRGAGAADGIAALSRQLEALTSSVRSRVAGILTPEQLTRLRQILLQVDMAALADPAMAGALNLTPDQQRSLALDRQRTLDAIGEGHQLPRARGPAGEVPCSALQANRTRLDPVLQQNQSRSRGVLTASQRTVLEQMEGKPLALTPPEPCRP
ncbi:hypothetical protein KBZ08_02240 [Cyanobium sp. Candia 9D4]|uniref:hypothetical protein n=1 Tax=Cyanobium sp. Candia 9D4 TaxID=2823707 RepID=UPI0020CC6F79|nr:hypothetical protein [Cyanobium sp. Candia 9D4]MCP9932728.1 hypothetical protein [Cyanobium sp. Candia 9D4]